MLYLEKAFHGWSECKLWRSCSWLAHSLCRADVFFLASVVRGIVDEKLRGEAFEAVVDSIQKAPES